MTAKQDAPATDEAELPDDFTSAWASVLLDLWVKQKPQESSANEESMAADATSEEVADAQ